MFNLLKGMEEKLNKDSFYHLEDNKYYFDDEVIELIELVNFLNEETMLSFVELNLDNVKLEEEKEPTAFFLLLRDLIKDDNKLLEGLENKTVHYYLKSINEYDTEDNTKANLKDFKYKKVALLIKKQ